MNTIQVVLDHAPAEIAELEEDIATMEERLQDSRARKLVLEQLLTVAQLRAPDAVPSCLVLVGERDGDMPRRALAGVSS